MVEQSDPPAGDPLRPIVVNIGKKKKKKKYSRGLEDLQRTGVGLTRVSSRIARSVAKGMKAFRKASDKSARKKRDGALRDSARDAQVNLGFVCFGGVNMIEEIFARIAVFDGIRVAPVRVHAAVQACRGDDESGRLPA